MFCKDLCVLQGCPGGSSYSNTELFMTATLPVACINMLPPCCVNKLCEVAGWVASSDHHAGV